MKKVIVELTEKEAKNAEAALNSREADMDMYIKGESRPTIKEEYIELHNDTTSAKKKISDAINKAKP
jgi:uncharacterized Rmd1/YagE family protein